jgi:hypothetical protein
MTRATKSRKQSDLQPWIVKLETTTAALVKDYKSYRQRLAEWLWWVERIWAGLASLDTTDRKALMKVRRDIDAAVPGWKKIRARYKWVKVKGAHLPVPVKRRDGRKSKLVKK